MGQTRRYDDFRHWKIFTSRRKLGIMMETRENKLGATVLEKLYQRLLEQVVPALEMIQNQQNRLHSQQEANAQALQSFRAEILTRFVEYHAELASVRAEVEGALQAVGLSLDRQGSKRSTIQ